MQILGLLPYPIVAGILQTPLDASEAGSFITYIVVISTPI